MLMTSESKLSGTTSAFSECRSGDPADQNSGSVKNQFLSPFFQSSLLSLVWWSKVSQTNTDNPNIFSCL